MSEQLPGLKPPPGEIVVECPKCGDLVSETCCAYQDYDYYETCYHWIKSGRIDPRKEQPCPKEFCAAPSEQ
ncbi:hypothetical protein ACRAVF_26965 [Bradyrhizobium oligotrophicum S58]